VWLTTVATSPPVSPLVEDGDWRAEEHIGERSGGGVPVTAGWGQVGGHLERRRQPPELRGVLQLRENRDDLAFLEFVVIVHHLLEFPQAIARYGRAKVVASSEITVLKLGDGVFYGFFLLGG
jgi:hypothetical protein